MESNHVTTGPEFGSPAWTDDSIKADILGAFIASGDTDGLMGIFDEVPMTTIDTEGGAQ